MTNEKMLFSDLSKDLQGCVASGDSIEAKGFKTVYVSKWHLVVQGTKMVEKRISLFDYKKKRWSVVITKDKTGYYFPIYLDKVNKNTKTIKI